MDLVRIEVDRPAPDMLSRKLWRFEFGFDYGLMLRMYTEQRRETKRHHWRGPRWDTYARERDQGLPAPTEIPESVIAEAIRKVTRHAQDMADTVWLGHGRNPRGQFILADKKDTYRTLKNGA